MLLKLFLQFVVMECANLTLFNQLPKHLRRRKWAYEIFTAVVIFTYCLISSLLVTNVSADIPV